MLVCCFSTTKQSDIRCRAGSSEGNALRTRGYRQGSRVLPPSSDAWRLQLWALAILEVLQLLLLLQYYSEALVFFGGLVEQMLREHGRPHGPDLVTWIA